MVGGPPPHAESVIRARSGREVQLKVHQCVWSGEYPGNSLPAILECYRAHVARAEIDIAILRDSDFLVVHDIDLSSATDGHGLVSATSRGEATRLHLAEDGVVSSAHPSLLSEVVDAIVDEPYPTLLELDLKDWKPWPWRRIEELAHSLQPVKARVTFGGGADWNLRRLFEVEPELRMGFTITDYLDWLPASCSSRPRNAYGYLDDHPLGRERLGSTRDYLWDRVSALVQLVPGARDIHVRLHAAERMREDGLSDLAELLHARGMLLDVWTLNAGSPGWREHLGAALEVGADVITTETPRELARAARMQTFG